VFVNYSLTATFAHQSKTVIMRKLKVLMTGLLLFVCAIAIAQKQVTGKVTDSKDGSPMGGVSVKVKGVNTGTSTESDGTFTLTMPKGLNDLVFSFVGYEDQEIAVKGNFVSLSLSPSAKSLNEVVVVGYGTSVKKEMTTAVARVKGAEVQNMPVPNLNQALQGRAAGVFVESQNGKVGEGIKVRIRGSGSVNSSNQPLYVVDGVPLAGGAFGSSTADINFNDVESFEILKDAAAAAIYGSRAANGVVLITTKRGKAGKTRFNLNTQWGTNEPTNKRGFLNAAEYLEFYREAAVNSGKYHYNRAGNWLGFSSEQAAIDNMKAWMEGRINRYAGWVPFRGGKAPGTIDNNWEDQAFQDAKVGQVELSAQGGNDKTKFYMAGNFNQQDGILVANKFERMGVRLNLDHQVNNWLKLGMNMGLNKITRKQVPDDNAFSTPMQIVALAPITPTRDSLGQLFDRPVATYYNPLIEVEETRRKTTGFRNQGSMFADIRLAKGLNLHTDLGLDMINQNEASWWGPRTLVGTGVNGYARNQWFRNTRWMTNNYLNYVNTFAEKHKVEVTAGMAYENQYQEYTLVEGQDFPDLALRTLGSTGEVVEGDGTIDENNLLSYFGRANYAFNGKYLLGASIRRDGDSRFGTNYKYGNFWAASAGWLLTEENFMKGIRFLSYLKPRVSYGTTGNNTGIGFYDARTQYGSTAYAVGTSTTSGLAVSRFGNDDLRWEVVKTLDIGLDFGLFNNRLTGEFDWYDRRTEDMLLNVPVPSMSGTTSVFGNVGSMTNTGVELTLNSVNIAKKDFRWTTSFNVARNRNELTKLDGEQKEILPNDARFANALIIGQPIGIFYAPKFVGADPANGDPLFLKEDGKTTTNRYDEAGKFIIGDPNPDWIGGITNTLTYKGFELSFLFQGVFGNEVQDGAGGFMSASGDWFDNQTRDQLNRWQKAGDQTMVPQARINRWGDFESPSISSRYVYDASYVRLKNLTFSYNVPSKWMNKVGMSNARVYVSGVNLLTFTDYPGWDPEVNTDYRSGNVNQGSDFYAAPQIKSVVFGLTLGF